MLFLFNKIVTTNISYFQQPFSLMCPLCVVDMWEMSSFFVMDIWEPYHRVSCKQLFETCYH
jgi:hypothetical protein